MMEMDIESALFYGLLLLLSIFLLIFILLLIHAGVFTQINVSACSPYIGEVIIAYKFARGPYKDSGALFTEAHTLLPHYRTLGVFYDDPRKNEASHLRYIVGLIISENGESVNKEDEVILKDRGFNFATFPKIQHAVQTTFPFNSTISIIVAVFRVYPSLNEYIESRSLCAHPFIEVYDENKIYFIGPLEKQDDFYVPEVKIQDETAQLEDEDDKSSLSWDDSASYIRSDVADVDSESIGDDSLCSSNLNNFNASLSGGDNLGVPFSFEESEAQINLSVDITDVGGCRGDDDSDNTTGSSFEEIDEKEAHSQVEVSQMEKLDETRVCVTCEVALWDVDPHSRCPRHRACSLVARLAEGILVAALAVACWNLQNQKKSRVDAALDENGMYDFTEDAKIFLNAIKDIGETSLGSILLFLKGSNAQRVKDHWKKCKTFGAGKNRSEGYWKSLGKLMIYGKYLIEKVISTGGGGRGWRGRGKGNFNSFSFTVLTLTQMSYDALRNTNQRILLEPSSEMKQELKYVIKIVKPTYDNDLEESLENQRKSEAGTSHVKTRFDELKNLIKIEKTKKEEKEITQRDPEKEKQQAELYTSLLQLRNQLGDESGFMPYMVASNRTLLLMASSMPTNIHKLKEVEGMTEAKIQKFGTQFVNHIVEFCGKNSKKLSYSVKISKEDNKANLTDSPSSSSGWLKPQKAKSIESSEDIKELMESNHSFDSKDSPLNKDSTKFSNNPESNSKLKTSNNNLSLDNKLLSGYKESYSHESRSILSNESHSIPYSESPSIPISESPSIPISESHSILNNESQSILNSSRLASSQRTNTFLPKPSSSFNKGVLFNNDSDDEDSNDTILKNEKSRNIKLENIDEKLENIAKQPMNIKLENTDEKSTLVKTENIDKKLENSDDKYERIRLENKRKLEDSGWINVKSMKNKVKKNSLFRR